MHAPLRVSGMAFRRASGLVTFDSLIRLSFSGGPGAGPCDEFPTLWIAASRPTIGSVPPFFKTPMQVPRPVACCEEPGCSGSHF